MNSERGVLINLGKNDRNAGYFYSFKILKGRVHFYSDGLVEHQLDPGVGVDGILPSEIRKVGIVKDKGVLKFEFTPIARKEKLNYTFCGSTNQSGPLVINKYAIRREDSILCNMGLGSPEEIGLARNILNLFGNITINPDARF